jgi:hypothetical protein
MVGNKQGANRIVNQIKKDGGYYDMEYTSSVYPILGPTSSLDEVPKEFLMGGNIDRALHIAGVKEATPAKIAEWQDEKRAKIESKQEASVDDLISKLNKTDLQIKAGLVENTDKTGADIKIKVANKLVSIEKDVNPLIEEKLKIEARRKQHERERQERIKIDFDELNFSRISNEARKQITEIVKQDLENKIKQIEKNTPEINEDDTMGTIGSKPKTQTDYAREHSKEFEAEVKSVIITTLKEKHKKRKPKTTKEWEDEFDLGGHE